MSPGPTLNPKIVDELSRCLAYLKLHESRPGNLYRPDVVSPKDARDRMLWALTDAVLELSGRPTLGDK
jgi:hypothetical protein